MSICDNMPKIPLPRYLREHGDEIQHIFDNAGKNADTWHYDASVWQKEFKDNSEVSDDLSEITKKYPDRITRSHVQSYARKIRPGSYQGIRRLFLACMIWGYGPDPNGQANTKLALSAPRLKAVLEESVERIKNTQKDGFKRLHKALLKGVYAVHMFNGRLGEGAWLLRSR